MPQLYTDAFEAACGRILAATRRDFELQVAKADALIAQLSARLLETEARCTALEASLKAAVDERLASVKDGADCDMDAVMRRVDEALAAIPAPKDGESVDPDEVRAMVADAVAALPPAEPGKDADPAEVERMVGEAVAAAVSALPAPEPGKDADPEEMRAAVDEAVTAAVGALPAPENGKDADPDVIARMIREALPDRDELRGPPGRLPIVKAWVDVVHYEGDVVTHEGATWQALKDTGRAPGGDDWACLAGRGAQGEPGRSMVHRGTYSADGEYMALDVVAMNGSSFVAKIDDPGACPGDGWQLVASRGGKGDAVKGAKGDPGPAPVAINLSDDGVLTLTMADGAELAADFYPILRALK